MQEPPCRILIGPLTHLPFLGPYGNHPNIKIFTNRPCTYPEDHYDIVYNHNEITHFNQILDYFPENWQPDIVIWCDLTYHSFIPGFEDCPYPTALIVGDWNLCYTTILNYCHAFDRIFTDRRLMGLLQQAGYHNVTWWPCFYYDPQHCYLKPESPKDYDITFIGNLNDHVHSKRSLYLERLTRLANRYRIFIRQGIYGKDYCHILNQSRIVFNFTICGVTNLRVFEAPACGALLFVEEDNLEVRDFLEPGQECVLYNTDNLEALFDYYLTHEDERQAIAAKGHAKVAQYTYEKQFAVLMQQLPAIIVGFQGSQQRDFHAKTFQQKQLYLARNAYYALRPNAIRWGFEQLQQAALQAESAEQIVTYNNGLAAILISSEINGPPSAHFQRNLQQARIYLQQALELQPDHALLHYHLGVCCFHLGDIASALQHYQDAYTHVSGLQMNEREWAEWLVVPLGYSRFKMDWENCGFTIETQEQPQVYQRLLASHMQYLMGQLYHVHHQYQEAIDAYRQSINLHPEHLDAAYALSHCLQTIGEIALAIAVCQPLCHQHPLWTDVRLLLYQLWFQDMQWQAVLAGVQETRAFIKLMNWPEHRLLLDDLERWAQVGLALAQGAASTAIVSQLPRTYSPASYQQAAHLLRVYSESYPQLYQGLQEPWAIQWNSPWPEGSLWRPATAAQITFCLQSRSLSFQRVLNESTDLKALQLGTDRLPLAFLPVLESVPFVLEDAGHFNLLVIVSDWSDALRWIPELRDISLTLVIWHPLSTAPEHILIELTALLEPYPETSVVLLSETLAAAKQQALLQSVNVVIGAPQGCVPFYLAWALWLGVPFICLHTTPLAIVGLPDTPDFYTDGPHQTIASIEGDYPKYRALAQAGQQQYQQFYAQSAIALQEQLWWEIRLQLLAEL